MRTILLLAFSLAICGCGLVPASLSPYSRTVDRYVAAAPNVELGMTKAQVRELLEPTQDLLKNSERKRPDQYRKEGVLVDIVYYRSGWNSDGITTDDEFTPYLFNDGQLVATGWHILGGARSIGQARDITTVSTSVHNTTIVY